MTLDARRLARVLAARGTVARVVVAGTRGSVPREAGAEMLVWADGQDGTIGGGALEWEAARAARALLAAHDPSVEPAPPSAGDPVVPPGATSLAPDGARAPRAPDHSGAASPPAPEPTATRRGEETRRGRRARPRLTRHPLGPALGQCCGGAVSLVTELLSEAPPGPHRALRLEGSAPEPGLHGPTRIEAGWLVEPVLAAREPLWIWGAGHVGRALAATLAPLERHDIAWIDVARDRFPEGALDPIVAADPPTLAARAPRDARHLIVTHSHELDLALCHALLRRGFASCGLIGSATKWARFRARLRALGHAEAALARIECPIGEPSLGKHPQAIAIGVAAALLRPEARLRATA